MCLEKWHKMYECCKTIVVSLLPCLVVFVESIATHIYLFFPLVTVVFAFFERGRQKKCV